MLYVRLREKKLLLMLKLMMLCLEWEGYRWCSMMEVLLILSVALLLEVIPFLSFVKDLRKHQVARSHCLKSCSIFSWPANTPQMLNSTNSKNNGKTEAIFAKKPRNSSWIFLDNSTPWPCSQWPYSTFKLTANSSKLIKVESINPSIGNFITRILWICWLDCHKFVLLFTGINIEIRSLFIPIVILIGLEISVICLGSRARAWRNASEAICRFTLIMKVVMSPLTLLISLDLL